MKRVRWRESKSLIVSRRQVLIVDEAGMVSTRDMTELIGLAKSSGARIVFSGDTAQIKSVEAGDALRVLERESKMHSFALREVVRQTNAEYREAVETIRNHPAEGFAKFEAMGAIREVDWREKPGEVARIYREEAALPNREGKQRSVLIEASTHDEIKSITHAIRQDRQRAGEIDRGETLQRHEALNWTEAQKKQCKKYQPGMLLEFHKAVKGVEKNETLEVISAEKTAIAARRASGEIVTLTAKQAKAFGVFEKQDIEVSAGDRLLLQANRREKGFRATNGELVTVASVEAGAIQLEDGRALPADYHQFTHGYAVTAHRSQGGKADFTIVMGDRMARDTFYVAVTRGQEGLAIVTSDSQGLQESIGVSADRQSAIELERRSRGFNHERQGKSGNGYARESEEFQFHQAQQTQQPERSATRQQAAEPELEVKQQVTRKELTRERDSIGIGI